MLCTKIKVFFLPNLYICAKFVPALHIYRTTMLNSIFTVFDRKRKNNSRIEGTILNIIIILGLEGHYRLWDLSAGLSLRIYIRTRFGFRSLEFGSIKKRNWNLFSLYYSFIRFDLFGTIDFRAILRFHNREKFSNFIWGGLSSDYCVLDVWYYVRLIDLVGILILFVGFKWRRT